MIPQPETARALESWARFWYRAVSAAFLAAYRETPGVAELLPADPASMRGLLRILLLDLATRKVGYELAHKPERLSIPAHAILELLETP